jgi:hypothetical protein
MEEKQIEWNDVTVTILGKPIEVKPFHYRKEKIKIPRKIKKELKKLEPKISDHYEK